MINDPPIAAPVAKGEGMKISERLRYYRRSRKKKLREVSAGTDLSVSYISDIERGRTLPSLATCQLLADFYGVTLTLMFSGVEVKASNL